jgi:hypothetical protein
MSENSQFLIEWLADRDSSANRNAEPSALEQVLAVLEILRTSGLTDVQDQDACSRTLDTLFRHCSKWSHENREALQATLIALGKASVAKFWRPAVQFLYLRPGDGDENVRTWGKTLSLTDRQINDLHTEAFHVRR